MMTGKNRELSSPDHLTDGEAQATSKKPYAKPRLSVYGNVEQITKGADAGSQDMDGQGGTSTGGGL
jgi:hypothetical protein